MQLNDASITFLSSQRLHQYATGFLQNGTDLSPAQSLDGSFRKSHSGLYSSVKIPFLSLYYSMCITLVSVTVHSINLKISSYY